MISSSSTRLVIATAIGVCIGLVIGIILFSPSSHHETQNNNGNKEKTTSSLALDSSSSSSSCPPCELILTPTQKKKPASPKIDEEHDSEETTSTTATVMLTNPPSLTKENPNVSASHHSRSIIPSLWNCDNNFDVDQIRTNYEAILSGKNKQLHTVFTKDTLHLTVSHFKTTMAILKDSEFRSCWKKILSNRRKQQETKKKSSSSSSSSSFFYDLGSRKLDQSLNFLQLYPNARNFNIVCFEPNPSFNPFYTEPKNRNKKIFHVNAAVGISDDSLRLTSRHVGSSIVKEGSPSLTNNNSSDDSQIVRVLPFIESMLGHYDKKSDEDTASSSSSSWQGFQITNSKPGATLKLPLPQSFRDRIIVKMDVEKAEFAILHHLVRTGAISLISELLLECHYNTNLPREKRDPEIHIGYDDCVDLVNAIRDAAPSGTMEVVLWNSMKTAQRTGRGYIERHGGFYPT